MANRKNSKKTPVEKKRINLDPRKVILDAGTQGRVGGHDEATINRYAELMAEKGVKHDFPPPVVFHDSATEKYYCSDGHHRVLASIKAEKDEIEVTVVEGTLRDAMWHSFGANRKNGLTLNPGDIKNIVTRILQDKTWTRESYRSIARHVGCSVTYVSKLAKEVGASRSNVRVTRRNKDGGITEYEQKVPDRSSDTAEADDSPVNAVEIEVDTSSHADHHAVSNDANEEHEEHEEIKRVDVINSVTSKSATDLCSVYSGEFDLIFGNSLVSTAVKLPMERAADVASRIEYCLPRLKDLGSLIEVGELKLMALVTSFLERSELKYELYPYHFFTNQTSKAGFQPCSLAVLHVWKGEEVRFLSDRAEELYGKLKSPFSKLFSGNGYYPGYFLSDMFCNRKMREDESADFPPDEFVRFMLRVFADSGSDVLFTKSRLEDVLSGAAEGLNFVACEEDESRRKELEEGLNSHLNLHQKAISESDDIIASL